MCAYSPTAVTTVGQEAKCVCVCGECVMYACRTVWSACGGVGDLNLHGGINTSLCCLEGGVKGAVGVVNVACEFLSCSCVTGYAVDKNGVAEFLAKKKRES